MLASFPPLHKSQKFIVATGHHSFPARTEVMGERLRKGEQKKG